MTGVVGWERATDTGTAVGVPVIGGTVTGANTAALPLAKARCDDRHGPIHRDEPHDH